VVQFKRDPIGEMLYKEGCLTASRLYAQPYPGQVFPFSLTQLPGVIRAVALGPKYVSCDDASAFHRIASTAVVHPRALEMMEEMMEDKDALFEKILTQGIFKSDVDASSIKEAIHALSNGQKLASTRMKLGDTGAWLTEWCHVQGEVTAEVCAGPDAARAVGLIDHYFPTKRHTIRFKKQNGVCVQLKKPETKMVKRDPRKTWRFFKFSAVEAQGMLAKIQYFKDNDITHGPPIHDDVPATVCSERNEDDPFILTGDERDELAETLTQHVRSTVPAYSLARVEVERIKAPEYETGVKSDKEAAEKVLKLYPHWKCCGGELYVFDDETGMWAQTAAAHHKMITRFTRELMKYKESIDKKGDVLLKLSQTLSYGNTLDLIKKLPQFIAMLCQDDDWEKNTGASSFGKILFKNGWYDGETGEFHKEFNPDIVFHGRIDRDFSMPDEDDEVNMADVEKRLFTIPLGPEVGNYLLSQLSRGFFADTLDEGVFIMGLGNTRSGKGIITTAFSNSCGDYCGTWNGENLKVKEGAAGGTDEAANQRWMIKCRYMRLIFSNELNSNIRVDGNMPKKNDWAR
jgi:hypothetical protein